MRRGQRVKHANKTAPKTDHNELQISFWTRIQQAEVEANLLLIYQHKKPCARQQSLYSYYLCPGFPQVISSLHEAPLLGRFLLPAILKFRQTIPQVYLDHNLSPYFITNISLIFFFFFSWNKENHLSGLSLAILQGLKNNCSGHLSGTKGRCT